jgi:hypothetical protein
MNVLLGLTQPTLLTVNFHNLRVARPREKLTVGKVGCVRIWFD